ncbi:protein involved in gliding motility GldB [Leeuwenhoekiella polynyae]|uniref:Protein involved in gliding motility GldB n=1 Tax=Leeuwenhoekiella polynyae TaxID=1550906 RepID=A0A4Q0PEM2_9FLAO|nr:gliding motility lipoprotein GldB [Leeuwenhoekiella polynyae]RXG25347.1 protein involved in gliding motility GldB [Leeuwenhoekiella polynyae]
MIVNLLKFKKLIVSRVGLVRVFGFFLGLLAFLMSGCNEDAKLPEEISQIPIDLKVARFDQKFAAVDSSGLDDLIRAYPFLFPETYTREFWTEKIKDTIQLELNKEVALAFPDFTEEQTDLETLFKHIKYYYPKTSIPEVITITSDVAYRTPVILKDSLLIIGLDNYLGPEHHFYDGIQRFYTQNFRKEQLDVDVADVFVSKWVRRKGNRRFLDEMIYHGKRLYMIERLLTLKDKNEIIGYTPEQYDWAIANEVDVWKYFIENELLFDSDSKLLSRFINPAPFSKFYLSFDNDSPPQLGRYIGWQIVKSYMQRNNIPLQMLPDKTSDEIFKQANYKPRK